MPPVVVPFYAALLALLFIVLSLRVIRLRRATGVPIGHAREHGLERSARVHANFAEYVPMAVILLAFVEVQGWSPVIVHGLCILLLAGRIIHALGVSREREDFRYRVAGMSMTFTVLGAASSLSLVGSLFPSGA